RRIGVRDGPGPLSLSARLLREEASSFNRSVEPLSARRDVREEGVPVERRLPRGERQYDLLPRRRARGRRVEQQLLPDRRRDREGRRRDGPQAVLFGPLHAGPEEFASDRFENLRILDSRGLSEPFLARDAARPREPLMDCGEAERGPAHTRRQLI